MYARVTRVTFAPERVGDAEGYIREEVLPVLQEQAGFKGFYQLVDRESGTVLGIALWDSRDAMQATSEMAKRLRAGAVEHGATAEPIAEEYEVAIKA